MLLDSDNEKTQCFNPCFNGSNTYTYFLPTIFKKITWVSILVLMDLILILLSYLQLDHLDLHVSILVLMDLILIQRYE